MQHILGEWGFRRLSLKVDGRALIPRPETEIVVERVLALLTGVADPRVLDVGTGSGAIALALADERPDARVTGIDTSFAALALARENAARLGLPVELERHDLFDGLPAGPWDAVVSNPPYISPSGRDSLAPEVRDWEPAAALFSEGATEAVAHAAVEVLADGGVLVLEVGRRTGCRCRLPARLGRLFTGARDRRPGRAEARRRGRAMSSAGEPLVTAAVAALLAGEVIVLPTDTVYGLAATADRAAGRDALYRLKGRDRGQPSALVAASVSVLFERVPELSADARHVVQALLPGPYTLVLPNPRHRYSWLCGADPLSIGVRVPELVGVGGDVLVAAGAVVATSANIPGGPEPRTVADVPEALRAGAAVVIDGGELPGVASTVLDLTGPEPRVVRHGAGDVESALARLGALA